MDALILSCGTGGGHNAAGRAIYEEMKKRGHHVVMRNPYALKSVRLSGRIDSAYVKTVQKCPAAFGGIYKIGDLYRRLPFRSPVYYANHAMNTVLAGYLKEHPFDIVVMPHLFPAEILTNMKRHGMTVPKTMFVATDYACIPFTEETDCDAYIIPAEDMRTEFVQRGIAAEKLHALGIPTHSSFAAKEDKTEVKGRLGLRPDIRYILAAGGSMGSGGMEQAVERLAEYFGAKEEIGLIVICGNNRRLYEKMKQRYGAGVTVLGHTDDMASYLKACSLYVTKPGGLSSTEAAVSGIPILHTAWIPGCETQNARYFKRHGMSLAGELTEEILQKAEQLVRDGDAAAQMVYDQQRQINGHAAADICTLAETMTGRNA